MERNTTLNVNQKDILEMAKKIEENAMEEKQLHINLHNKIVTDVPQEKPLIIGKTPNVLVVCGANDELVLSIDKKNINKAMRKEKINEEGKNFGTSSHGLSEEELRNALNNIKSPIMILKGSRDGSLVVVTEQIDKSDREIIVAVHLDREKSKEMVVNDVVSVYGKDKFAEYIERQDEENNILAVNIEKTDEFLQARELHLSKREDIICFDNSISYTMKNVKYPGGAENQKNEEKENTAMDNVTQKVNDMSLEEKESLVQGIEAAIDNGYEVSDTDYELYKALTGMENNEQSISDLYASNQAEELINTLEANKTLFWEEERDLIVNYAYKFDDMEKTRELAEKLVDAIENGNGSRMDIVRKAEAEIDALPDGTVGLSQMHEYGYEWPEMLPLTQERAIELFKDDVAVYQLHADGTETVIEDMESLQSHDGMFGVEKNEWNTYLEYQFNQEVARDIDQHEAEYGADGSRAFPHLNEDKKSIFSIRVYDEEIFYENTSNMDLDALCKAYGECEKPFVEMSKYGKQIDGMDFAYIQQSDKCAFSLEFDENFGMVTVYDGHSFETESFREKVYQNLGEPYPRWCLDVTIPSEIKLSDDKISSGLYEYESKEAALSVADELWSKIPDAEKAKLIEDTVAKFTVAKCDVTEIKPNVWDFSREENGKVYDDYSEIAKDFIETEKQSVKEKLQDKSQSEKQNGDKIQSKSKNSSFLGRKAELLGKKFKDSYEKKSPTREKTEPKRTDRD